MMLLAKPDDLLGNIDNFTGTFYRNVQTVFLRYAHALVKSHQAFGIHREVSVYEPGVQYYQYDSFSGFGFINFDGG